MTIVGRLEKRKQNTKRYTKKIVLYVYVTVTLFV